MRGNRLVVAAAVALGASLFVAPEPARAAPKPIEVYSVIEGTDAGTGRTVLVIVGKLLNKYRGVRLLDEGDVEQGTPEEKHKTGTMLILDLPSGLPAGRYTLELQQLRADPVRVAVNVTYGIPGAGSVDGAQLAAGLRSDLDDATTLAGRSPSFFQDATNLNAGKVRSALYSAIEDLTEEGAIGTGASQVAQGNHHHAGVYVEPATLSAIGQINAPTNPVHWTQLRGVPPEIADGADEAGVYTAGAGLKLSGVQFTADFAGSGGSQTVARSDHDHDARYYPRTMLDTLGTINSLSNPVDWTRLKGVPLAFSDGVDDDTLYTAGPGLKLLGTEFSVGFGTAGTSNLVARADHSHDTLYAGVVHDHDGLYYRKADLDSGGTLNASGNPLAWTRLRGVPSGFADEVDDDTLYTAGAGLLLSGTEFRLNFSGTGSASTAAHGDHHHDGAYATVAHHHDSVYAALVHDHNALYYTKNQMDSGGAVNDASNPIVWSRLKGVPAAFADGVDNDTTYTAGAGLSLTSGQFAVNLGSDGASNSVARADHTHANTFVSKSGDAMSGALTASISGAGTAISGLNAATSTSGTVGVRGQGNTGLHGTGGDQGVYGIGNVGVWGDTTGQGGTRVGVYGRSSNSGDVAGMFALASGAADGTPAFIANQASTNGGDIARFQRNGSTVASIGSGGSLSTSGISINSGNVTLSSGTLTAATSSSATPLTTITGISGTGVGVHGSGPTGVQGSGTNMGVYGVGPSGVFGDASSASGARGVYGRCTTRDADAAVYAECTASPWPTYTNPTPLICNNSGSDGTGNIAVFRSNGSNVARIDRSGKGYFNGGTQSSGADFAESVAVKGDPAAFEPGDVIVVDVGGVRRFALSTEAESTLVAGVYSTKPALLGTTHDVAGHDGALEGEIPLGIVGIVPTKVCDEGGPIRAGDLLVTASVPGHAKKAPRNAAQGTVLGKALGTLAKGRGKVEVLISLQ